MDDEEITEREMMHEEAWDLEALSVNKKWMLSLNFTGDLQSQVGIVQAQERIRGKVDTLGNLKDDAQRKVGTTTQRINKVR